jgi:AbrB family looped-hinge helix DNA binding protein
MVQLKVKLGPKGQVVIPQIFREHFHLYPGQEAIIKDEEEGILIKKQGEDPIELIEKTAKKATEKRKGKKLTIDSDKDYYEQFEKRTKRAGL